MSQTQAHSVTIGGQAYNVYRCDPEKGLGLVARLTKLVGPAVAVASSARGKAGEGDADALIDQTIVQAAKALAEAIDAPEVVRLVKDLLSMVEIVGTGMADQFFSAHFVGRYAAIFQLCGEVIRHNGFFDGIGSLGGALAQ